MEMQWHTVKKLSGASFRRLTGVKRVTFEKMIELLTVSHREKKSRGGRPNKLSLETMLLMTLEYLREYRTYFHIGNSYGVSESYAYKIIRWVEETLIKADEFHLPGKKALLKSDVDYEVILVDASESPIERPKKNKNVTTLARKKDTR